MKEEASYHYHHHHRNQQQQQQESTCMKEIGMPVQPLVRIGSSSNNNSADVCLTETPSADVPTTRNSHSGMSAAAGHVIDAGASPLPRSDGSSSRRVIPTLEEDEVEEPPLSSSSRATTLPSGRRRAQGAGTEEYEAVDKRTRENACRRQDGGNEDARESRTALHNSNNVNENSDEEAATASRAIASRKVSLHSKGTAAASPSFRRSRSADIACACSTSTSAKAAAAAERQIYGAYGLPTIPVLSTTTSAGTKKADDKVTKAAAKTKVGAGPFGALPTQGKGRGTGDGGSVLNDAEGGSINTAADAKDLPVDPPASSDMLSDDLNSARTLSETNAGAVTTLALTKKKKKKTKKKKSTVAAAAAGGGLAATSKSEAVTAVMEGVAGAALAGGGASAGGGGGAAAAAAGLAPGTASVYSPQSPMQPQPQIQQQPQQLLAPGMGSPQSVFGDNSYQRHHQHPSAQPLSSPYAQQQQQQQQHHSVHHQHQMQGHQYQYQQQQQYAAGSDMMYPGGFSMNPMNMPGMNGGSNASTCHDPMMMMMAQSPPQQPQQQQQTLLPPPQQQQQQHLYQYYSNAYQMGQVGGQGTPMSAQTGIQLQQDAHNARGYAQYPPQQPQHYMPPPLNVHVHSSSSFPPVSSYSVSGVVGSGNSNPGHTNHTSSSTHHQHHNSNNVNHITNTSMSSRHSCMSNGPVPLDAHHHHGTAPVMASGMAMVDPSLQHQQQQQQQSHRHQQQHQQTRPQQQQQPVGQISLTSSRAHRPHYKPHQEQQQQQRQPPQSQQLLLTPSLPTHRYYPHPLSFTPEVSPALSQLAEEEVVAYLIPSLYNLHRRRAQLRSLAEYITEAIRSVGGTMGRTYGDVRFYIFGSVNMRTVLPDGDNDITVEVDGLLSNVPPQEDTEEKVKTSSSYAEEAATTATTSNPSSAAAAAAAAPLPMTTDSNSGNKEGTMQLSTLSDGRPFLVPPTAITMAAGDLLGKVSDYLKKKPPVYVDALVLAEVRVLKLAVEGSSYDVTVGQFGGVNCVRFLHEMDAVIGGQHLLKRTLLLLKSWCCYEAHVLGGQAGYIGSYAATVMLIAMLNIVEFIEDVADEEARNVAGDAAACEHHVGVEAANAVDMANNSQALGETDSNALDAEGGSSGGEAEPAVLCSTKLPNCEQEEEKEARNDGRVGGSGSRDSEQPPRGEGTGVKKEDEGDSDEFLYRNPTFRTARGPLTPLALVARFLKFYSYFDFEHYCVTAFGPLPLKTISSTPLDLARLEVSAAHSLETDCDAAAANEEEALSADGEADSSTTACEATATDIGSDGDVGARRRDKAKSQLKNKYGVDTSFLGLTAEGEAAIGHLIRRRTTPLLTVAGVKHLLHEMNTSRRTEREERYNRQHPEEGAAVKTGAPTGPNPASCAAGGASQHEDCSSPLRAKAPGEEDASSAEEEGWQSTYNRVCLNRRADQQADQNLICPSCNSAVFPVRCMNVLDPLRWSSNMVRGVCRNHLQRIHRAFKEGLRMFEEASAELDAGSGVYSRRCGGGGGGLEGISRASAVSANSGYSGPQGDFLLSHHQQHQQQPCQRNVFTPSQSSAGEGSYVYSQQQQQQQQQFGYSTASGMVMGGGGNVERGVPPSSSSSIYDMVVVPGYPAPDSLRTQREVGVLQYLFGNTISTVQRYSSLNNPWGQRPDGMCDGGEDSVSGMPQCPTCGHPSLLCTPDIARTCEPQFVFRADSSSASSAQPPQQPQQASSRKQRLQMGLPVSSPTDTAPTLFGELESNPRMGPLGNELLPPIPFASEGNLIMDAGVGASVDYHPYYYQQQHLQQQQQGMMMGAMLHSLLPAVNSQAAANNNGTSSGYGAPQAQRSSQQQQQRPRGDGGSTMHGHVDSTSAGGLSPSSSPALNNAPMYPGRSADTRHASAAAYRGSGSGGGGGGAAGGHQGMPVSAAAVEYADMNVNSQQQQQQYYTRHQQQPPTGSGTRGFMNGPIASGDIRQGGVSGMY